MFWFWTKFIQVPSLDKSTVPHFGNGNPFTECVPSHIETWLTILSIKLLMAGIIFGMNMSHLLLTKQGI